MNKLKKYFFCGIGGSGMSPLAQVLSRQDCIVCGSDRSYDQNKNRALFENLTQQEIKLFAQDGSGVDSSVDFLVVSSAIEEKIPDVKKAVELGIKIIKRSELLAEIFHKYKGIAIGGTSGKSTVTGMVGHILQTCEKSPVVINGGVMLNVSGVGLGNCLTGNGEYCVIEADESDGSIEHYNPFVSVVTNITLDHKPIEELRPLFSDFVKKADCGTVINVDCPEAVELVSINPRTLTFGIENPNADIRAVDIKPIVGGVSFNVYGINAKLQVSGRYNVSNALAAIATAKMLGISFEDSIEALKSFKGIRRRMELVGIKNNVTVIDDFAHNPDKIAASLETLKEHDGRLLVMYQPHGFKPTKFLRKGLVQSFSKGLSGDDCLLMPEIFYAGGTTNKDISSADIINDVKKNGRNAVFFETRNDIADYLVKNAKAKDRIVIMGARDDTLTDFAKNILENIK
ncbi:MAG: UDP-N-acetylmuramate--alanine ligase [Alphaproteobacteria bacterium]|nr:UDP-N-acetylmuramate--alanine ligase [Alphaproteobacteria bacterium]